MSQFFKFILPFFAFALNLLFLGIGLYATYLFIIFLRLGIKFLRNNSR